MAKDSDSKGFNSASNQTEKEDIAIAIAASLAAPKQNLPYVQDRWIPQTADDWKVYRRQKGLEETAHDNRSLAQEQNLVREPGNLAQPPPKDYDSLTEGNGMEDSVKKFWGPNMSLPKGNTDQTEAEHPNSRSEIGNSQPESSESKTPEAVDSVPQSPSPRQTIEDRIKEMELGNPVDLPWVDDYDGDTWVFIDPAAQQPEQTDQMYKAYVERYAKPLVIKSTTLRRLQSPFFDKRLEPSFQFRTLRRRNLVKRLPSQIKHVIDLTPPTEGDEAAWLMSELCCADGVRKWSQSAARWQVSKTLVGGRDEFTVSIANTPDVLPPPELSPIRHRACIERVLNAIRGIDPKLDSAVKVYTTFAVARFFDITQSPLTDYIIRWIRAPPNSLFIEALPEIALKIGDGLQCLELIRDSFAILVGEEAQDLLSRTPNPGFSVYGRKKNDIPESYKTRIEYASKSFLERVFQGFEDLTEHKMSWMATLPEFEKLLDITDENLSSTVDELKLALKAYVRGTLFTVLYSHLSWAPSLQLGSEGGDSLYPRISRHAFWDSLDMKKRIMTTALWEALKQPRFYSPDNNVVGVTNLTIWSAVVHTWVSNINHGDLTTMIREHGVKEVLYSHLVDLSYRCRNARSSSWAGEKVSLQSLRDQPRESWDSLLSLLDTQETLGETLPAAHQEQIFWDSEGNPPSPRLVHTGTQSLQTNLGPSEPVVGSAYPRTIEDDSDIGFYLPSFGLEAERYIQSVCQKMLSPPDADRREPMEMEMTSTLVGLDQAEWKYLPLYAGGLDDGSGGVFNDDVPVAEIGFSTAGPRVHTGTGSSTASSEFDFVGRDDLESTHHTSTMTNDSFSDQMDHRTVYDGNSELWEEVMKGKNVTGTITESRAETSTLVAPSTFDGESEDGFVLPVRSRLADLGVHPHTDDPRAKETPKGGKSTAAEEDDYGDIFRDDSDEEPDTNKKLVYDDDDDDDDTATEKGENASDDDEDMVIV